MKQIKCLLTAMLFILAVVGCKKDEPVPTSKEVIVTFNMPQGDANVLSNIVLKLKHKESGKETVLEGLKSNSSIKITLDYGQYDLSAEGSKSPRELYKGQIPNLVISEKSAGTVAVNLIYEALSKTFKVAFSMPEGDMNTLENIALKFTNQETKKETLFENLKSNEEVSLTLDFGKYNVVALGDKDEMHRYEGRVENVAVTKEMERLPISLIRQVPENAHEVTFVFNMPKGDINKLSNIALMLSNKETGKKIVLENLKSDERVQEIIPLGIYDITAQGSLNKQQYIFGQSDVTIDKSTKTIIINLLQNNTSKGLLIREIFYSGATKTKGKGSYTFAHYVVLNNNSDETLYADSLVFVGTASNTKIAADKYRSYLPKAVVADFAFMIPGNGKSHPVKPGQDLVICMEAKNHNEIASNAPNLARKAHFEWFEPNDIYQLTDNPKVPNMEILFKTSRTITALHMRGYVSYFIFKLTKSKERLFKENAAMFPYPNPKVPPVLRPIIPAEWILDGVELFDQAGGITKALPATVDKTHTFCSETGKGYTIQRKVAMTVKGRKVYRDTNDSMSDFERDKPSSLL